MTKHFINLDDIPSDDLQQIITQAILLKKQHKAGEINNRLKNKTLAMIFDKSSTRTRVSFEAGMTQLGGHALFLSDRDIQLGRGEPITDSAIVISSMVDAIMMRVSSHEAINTFSFKKPSLLCSHLSSEEIIINEFLTAEGILEVDLPCWLEKSFAKRVTRKQDPLRKAEVEK